MALGKVLYKTSSDCSVGFPELDKKTLGEIPPLCNPLNSPTYLVNREITFKGVAEGFNVYFVQDVEGVETGDVIGYGSAEIHLKNGEVAYLHSYPRS